MARAKETPDERYARHLRHKYNLTPKDVNALRRKQKNRCGICGHRFTKTPRLDHDHNTGEIRGLLCGKCNRGLGFLGDNMEGLLAAVRYLERHYECE